MYQSVDMICIANSCAKTTCKTRLLAQALLKSSDFPRLLRTFGEGCSQAFVIQVVMPLGHLLAIAPTTFFNSMR
jgi:hypothetical protein